MDSDAWQEHTRAQCQPRPDDDDNITAGELVATWYVPSTSAPTLEEEPHNSLTETANCVTRTQLLGNLWKSIGQPRVQRI